jgi:hypothetical protein
MPDTKRNKSGYAAETVGVDVYPNGASSDTPPDFYVEFSLRAIFDAGQVHSYDAEIVKIERYTNGQEVFIFDVMPEVRARIKTTVDLKASRIVMDVDNGKGLYFREDLR